MDVGLALSMMLPVDVYSLVSFIHRQLQLLLRESDNPF